MDVETIEIKTITFERDGKTHTAVVKEPRAPWPNAMTVEDEGVTYGISIGFGTGGFGAHPFLYRFVQFLNEQRTEYVEWWPNDERDVAADALGRVFLAQREHPSDMWGPPEQIGDLATLDTARWFAFGRGLMNEKAQS
jgi:hypothetical protein